MISSPAYLRKCIVACLLAVVIASTMSPCFGFGKNKVHYAALTWNYHEIPHFKSYFHEDQGDLPAFTAQVVTQAYRQYSKQFDFTHQLPVPLIVFGSPILFEQTNVIPDLIPEGVGGFTESIKNRIVVPFDGSYNEFHHVLRHELVHAFQYGIMFDQFGGSLFQSNSLQLPLWFAEGSAEYLSSGWDVSADMYLMDRTINGNVPLPGPEMNDYMVYKGGQSFLFFLASSRGEKPFIEFLKGFRKTKQVVESLEKVYKQSLEELGAEWHHEIRRIYWPELGKRENLKKKAYSLTAKPKSRSYSNLNPRISPDGSMIAYYTDLNDYTEIAIADTAGKILQRLGQRGYGGYFEAFQPFRSGLCWSPQSDRLAFVTKNHGTNELRIINIKNRKLIKTFAPDLLSISDPDWSQNGKNIVFSGLSRDRIDLYMVSLETDSVVRLTDDIFTESRPRFSRDGSTIAFAGSDTTHLNDTNRRGVASDLYLYDVVQKNKTRITSTPWNESQPCFSPEGNRIAFVSDQNGISNIYIAPIDAIDSAKALTNIIGGCSHPDWSQEHNTIVFSLFQKGGWDIWSIDDPLKKTIDGPLPPTRWVETMLDTTLHFFLPDSIAPDLPDSTKSAEKSDSKKTRGPDRKKLNTEGFDASAGIGPVSTQSSPRPLSSDSGVKTAPTMLASTETSLKSQPADSGKIDSITFPLRLPEKKPYKIEFTLDAISVGMAVNSYYSGIAGQGTIFLSDLLGNHQIAIAGNMQGSLQENNFFLAYFNTQHRLNFGISGFFSRNYAYADSITPKVRAYYHDTQFGSQFMLRYPFSLFSRVDMELFFERIHRITYIFDEQKDPDNLHEVDSAATDFNITQPSLNYVFDNILWGITGPVNGSRVLTSLTVAPGLQSNDAAYISLDGDFRNYIHINKQFVWANRVAVGFSESLNDKPSQRRYFIGGDEYTLNYNFNDKVFEENLHNLFYSSYIVPFRGWDLFDISGTRYAVFNTEFRFPLIRTIELVWPLPIAIRYINGAIFVDAGNAWDKKDEEENLPLPKKIYGGAGFGLRTNLGFLVLRYDIAWKTNWRNYLKDGHHYISLGAEF